jgi:hypothetical protein
MAQLSVVSGDLLSDDLPETYVCHQTYCSSARSDAAGLAKFIFKKHPSANVYAKRAVDSTPGTIEVRGKFIAFMAQYYPGKSHSAHDSYELRAVWFQECLDALAELLQPGESVAFPRLIGCDLAGGDHEGVYLPMLTKFADKHPVTLYKKAD